MSALISAAKPCDGASTLYRNLKERILARDQVGASEAFYNLAQAGRPLN